MEEARTGVDVRPVDVGDPGVLALVDALTAELADGGYAEEETFGYSPEQLAAAAVHVVGARVDGDLVGIGGIELQDAGVAELKRFYVVPSSRGRGVADAIMAALVQHAASSGARRLRLETGDKQQAAMGFYRRHGFAVVARFGPYVASATSVCMSRDLAPEHHEEALDAREIDDPGGAMAYRTPVTPTPAVRRPGRRDGRRS